VNKDDFIYEFSRVFLVFAIAAISIIFIWYNSLREPDFLSWNGWAFSEWLINYGGGFVRRGLAGELLNNFSYGHETVVINWIVFLSATLFATLASILALTLKKMQAMVVYLVAPTNFFSMAMHNEYYYRKEILFYIAMMLISILFLIWRSSKRLRFAAVIIAMILGFSAVMPLIHEGYIFFSCLYFSVIAYHLLSHHIGVFFAKNFVVAFVVANALFFLAMALFKGTPLQVDAIWASLSDAARIHGQKGAISAIGWSTLDGLSLSVKAVISGMATYYLFSLALVYLVVAFIYSQIRGLLFSAAIKEPLLLANYALITIAFLPLFALGWDWGRWVVGIFVMFSLLTIVNILIPFNFQSLRYRLSALSSAGVAFAILLSLQLISRTPECCISGSGGVLNNPSARFFASQIKELLR
jgi:hypothetical protein